VIIQCDNNCDDVADGKAEDHANEDDEVGGHRSQFFFNRGYIVLAINLLQDVHTYCNAKISKFRAKISKFRAVFQYFGDNFSIFREK
jgi:hypothetical protein